MKKICKWYYSCQIKQFVEEGKKNKKWTENYCLIGNKSGKRFKMEKQGINHPNNMLPDGKIMDSLK